MCECTAQELQDARAPIESLLSKSEKARSKVAPGTWQHAMLEGNVGALRLALALFDGMDDEVAGADLDAALDALDSMIDRVGNTKSKFEPGTSQHSLQRNRLDALCVARRLVAARSGTGG